MRIENLESALIHAINDDSVGIKIANLAENDTFSAYVTQLSVGEKVSAHFHNEGVEIYQILSGEGVIVTKTNDSLKNSEKSIFNVKKGDFFTINPRTIHQLMNTGNEQLILIFFCPKNHLSTDRVMVDNLI